MKPAIARPAPATTIAAPMRKPKRKQARRMVNTPEGQGDQSNAPQVSNTNRGAATSGGKNLERGRGWRWGYAGGGTLAYARSPFARVMLSLWASAPAYLTLRHPAQAFGKLWRGQPGFGHPARDEVGGDGCPVNAPPEVHTLYHAGSIGRGRVAVKGEGIVSILYLQIPNAR